MTYSTRRGKNAHCAYQHVNFVQRMRGVRGRLHFTTLHKDWLVEGQMKPAHLREIALK